MTMMPLSTSTSSRSDVPTATKKITSTGERRALDGRLQRIALGERQVLDHQASGHGRQQRLELLCAADLAEQRADRDDDERDLSSDVAQVEREQRAHEDAERHGAADLPCEAREQADAVARWWRQPRRARRASPARRAPG